jgi:amidase
MAGITRRGFGVGLAAVASHGVSAAKAEVPSSPFVTATDLRQALAQKKVSSRELTDAAIARIESLDGKTNAVVVRDFDRARAAADAADVAIAKGESKPLLGLPMTVKEQYNVAGLPTSWGYTKFRNWRPSFDALTVQRLKAAGVVILGKTNVPVGLSDWQSYNDVYGQTNNPWNLGRTPGGSSGGAAAALAAGFVPLELGSDIGGSLRAPAHFCGVFSHKPSVDVVPARGSGYPDTPPLASQDYFAVCGPMARSAADLALELSVLAGPDPEWSGIGYRLELPAPKHERIADFRVLVIDHHPLLPTSEAVSGAVSGLGDRLAKLGCTVMRTHPDMPDLARTTRVYIELLLALYTADLTADEAARARGAVEMLSPENLGLGASRLRGLTMSHGAWLNTMRIRSGLRARWQALFESVDVVLCPPMPTTAFPHDHGPQLQRMVSIDGAKVSYGDQVAWSAVATMTGLPASVAPIGHGPDGLPIGVQIIGSYLSDLTTIAFAGMIEREFGGFVPPPDFA